LFVFQLTDNHGGCTFVGSLASLRYIRLMRSLSVGLKTTTFLL
jgi:hypothetical protein